MNYRITLATAARVLTQLRHDPRTVALLIIVPVMLLSFMKGVFLGRPDVFQQVAVPLLGIFSLESMFAVTSITMLRERTTGTLERLMTMPVAKFDLLAGYGIAFGVLATVQAAAVSVVAFGPLDVEVSGTGWAVVAVAVLNALLGTSLGLFVSAFAQTEFQAVQFLPAFLLPQFLLSGLLAPRESMARGLEIVSNVLPLTYAYDALRHVATQDRLSTGLTLDVVVLLGSTLIALALGALTLRRRTD